MTSTQTKPPEPKRKRFRGEVTHEQLNQFLARPASKIQNLDRNLRKSYYKGFFRQQQFDDIRELKKKMENNEEDSVEQMVNSDESLFSLHNDKRTLRKRERQRNNRKTQEVKKEEGTTDQNQTKPEPKKKKRPPPKKKPKQPQKKKQKAAETQNDESSQNSQDSDSSSTESSNSEDSESSSEEKQSEQKSQKGKKQQLQANETVQIKQQEVTKKNNLDEENQDSQNDMKQESESQSQIENKQQGQLRKQAAEEKKESKDEVQKYLIKDPAQTRGKLKQEQKDKQTKINNRPMQESTPKYKEQNKQMSLISKTATKQNQSSEKHSYPITTPENIIQKSLRNRRRYGKEYVTTDIQNNKKTQIKQLQNKTDTIPLSKPKSQTKNQQTQKIVKIQPEKQKVSVNKTIQNIKTNTKSQIQVKPIEKQPKIQNPQISRKQKWNQIFIVQPTKRQHHLQYCSKVIVESFMFRNYYIIAPYLAVSQLSTPFQIPVTAPNFQPTENKQGLTGLTDESPMAGVKQNENLLRKKRIIQDFQNQQQRQSQRKRPEKEPSEQTSPKNVSQPQQSKTRNRRNR